MKANRLLPDRNPNTYNLFLKRPENDLHLDDHTNTPSWKKQNNLGSDSQNSQFYKSNLDLDPMTLVLKLDLDIVKMYIYIKNKVSVSRHLQVIEVIEDRQTHRQTHTQMNTQTV